MPKLSTAGRNALPAKTFALPKSRVYPIPDKGHAKAALTDVSAYGTPAQKTKVRAKVAAQYPSMKVKGR